MQQSPSAAARFATLDQKEPMDAYNFKNFRTKHLLQDGKRTLRDHGILPGEIAPDFELPRSDGGTLRLSELRGQPVILHFGSFT
jgi:hypothetical protein